MRLYLFWSMFLFMAGYAWVNWFRAALFLVLSMAIVERPDFPKQVLGIPGLNPWNLLMLSSLAAFMVDKQRAPGPVQPIMRFLMIYYPLFILIAFLREIWDMDGIIEFAEYMGARPIEPRGLLIDDLFNSLKYLIPGLLIYFGCTDRQRMLEGATAILAMNFILGALTIKSMGFDALGSGTELEQTAIRRLDRDIGYYRSDLAILLAGGSWAIFAMSRYVQNRWYSLALVGASGVCALAIGLSGGRMGMAAWGILALCFGIIRFRSILIYGPLALILVVSFVPAVQDRLLQGIVESEETEVVEGDVDMDSVTSGRVIAWPAVIERISESPFLGYGRRAMQRIGLSKELGELYDKPFAHPHNAYLQLLLDNGIILGLPILIVFMLLLKVSVQLMLDARCKEFALVGSIAFAFVLSFLAGGVAQQSFYPFIGSVSIWASIALMLRVYADREQYVSDETPTEVDAIESPTLPPVFEQKPLWQKR